jgi:hypothetical protein
MDKDSSLYYGHGGTVTLRLVKRRMPLKAHILSEPQLFTGRTAKVGAICAEDMEDNIGRY